MIKEDIPCVEFTDLLQFMVQALNETQIYLPHKNSYSTQDGARHVLDIFY